MLQTSSECITYTSKRTVIAALSAQENFQWPVIDSTAKAKDVIQNDDKKGGTIILLNLMQIIHFYGKK